MNKLVNVLFILVFLTSTFLFSQEDQHNSETSSTVPELFDFHEIIYPIWHTAYPEKNYSMLKEMAPQVQEGAAKIYSAKLPGILRDKQKEWDNGIAKFKSSVDSYCSSMKETDETKMLSAAEELHSDFELLVRIVKPITKEVDEFHKVLYMIYHHYWPNKNMAELSKAVDDLELRAEELHKCALPKWAADKSDDFMKQSQMLYDSTQKLKELKDAEAGNDELDKAIEDVHNNYTALERLFD